MRYRIRRQVVLVACAYYFQTILCMNISPARNYCGNYTSYICASLIIFSLWISWDFPPLEESSRSVVFLSQLSLFFLLPKQISSSSKFFIQLACSSFSIVRILCSSSVLNVRILCKAFSFLSPLSITSIILHCFISRLFLISFEYYVFFCILVPTNTALWAG